MTELSLERCVLLRLMLRRCLHCAQLMLSMSKPTTLPQRTTIGRRGKVTTELSLENRVLLRLLLRLGLAQLFFAMRKATTSSQLTAS